jgi:hypothetical protein
MTDTTLSSGFAVAAAPALKVRGYWGTVGYRLRYDYSPFSSSLSSC